MNFFEIFEIQPPRLALDSAELEKKFYELSRKFHPDHQADSPEAVENSAALNAAYKALRDPWGRANYVLKLNRISLDSKLPPTLTALYFELQETEDREALSRLRRDLLTAKDQRLSKLLKAFHDHDNLAGIDSSKQTEVLKVIQTLVLENNYAASMLRDLEARS